MSPEHRGHKACHQCFPTVLISFIGIVYRWHHQLNLHEFEQSPGDGEGQGSLMCCNSWGHKKSNLTERLNNKSVQRVGAHQENCNLRALS